MLAEALSRLGLLAHAEALAKWGLFSLRDIAAVSSHTDLPPEVPEAARKRLRQHARDVVDGRPFVSGDGPAATPARGPLAVCIIPELNGAAGDGGAALVGDLQDTGNTKPPAKPNVSIDDLIGLSKSVRYAELYPISANRIEALSKQGFSELIEAHAAATRPVSHHKVEKLIDRFIRLMMQISPYDTVYRGMSVRDFVDRCLTKRPLAFFGISDRWLLGDGRQGRGGFESIGTSEEGKPLVLTDLLSYDEMPLSALLMVSTPTIFINAGARRNKGVPEEDEKIFERKGVFVACVGARLEKPGVMEWKHVVIDPQQNTAANGYGANADLSKFKTKLLRLWAKFYGLEYLPDYAEAQEQLRTEPDRYAVIPLAGSEAFFNINVYAKRMRVVLEAFLLEAEARGQQASQSVYCHLVGLPGLYLSSLHPSRPPPPPPSPPHPELELGGRIV